MNEQLIIAFIIILRIRKSFQTAIQLPWWDKILLPAMYACVALQVIEISFHWAAPVVKLLSYIIVFGILGIVYLEEAFESFRPTVVAVLPFILVLLLGDTIQLFGKDFYNNWHGIIDTAKFFAFIWMVTMLIINRKQRKALDKERLKTQEEERQNKIMATLKAELEVQVAERTAEITSQKNELEHALTDLKSTQAQLIQSEKLASLGELTAGIAHEIQNPLNFVNNFSEVNTELIEEMKHEIDKGNFNEVKIIANDIKENELKINHHGKRADAIVKGMLQHSRSSNGVKEPTDINALADEYLRLAYHGLRAKDKSFNATMITDFDKSLDAGDTGIGKINIIPQDIGRVILNLITNAFYTVTEKKKHTKEGYEPTIWVSTKKMGNKVLIAVKDNGSGVPPQVLDKIFQPFFTTKPTGKGTGLGLSISYDIVSKAHGGEMKVESVENEWTEMKIILPV